MKFFYLFWATLLMVTAKPMNAEPFEVLHWWTEKGEMAAKDIMVKHLNHNIVDFDDATVFGAGGDTAIRVLQIRTLAGDLPDAAQIKNPDIKEWNEMDLLIGMNRLVNTANWASYFPLEVQENISIDQRYMAVPINIHRVNWLWVNNKIFRQYGLSAPKTWDDFFKVAHFLETKGINPLVVGGTPFQDIILFESVALSLLGPEKYLQAFVEMDQNVINSDEMLETFKLFKKLNRYNRTNKRGINWFLSSQPFLYQQSAMFFMGDWVKSAWHKTGSITGSDYTCVTTPGTKGIFSYTIDSFVIFKKDSSRAQERKKAKFINTLISKDFQKEFSQSKGSIPARNDINLAGFDACSQRAAVDFKHDIKVPSLSQNMIADSNDQAQITKLISDFFNNDSMLPEQAVKHLSIIMQVFSQR